MFIYDCFFTIRLTTPDSITTSYLLRQSRNFPVPLATHETGSSATVTGT